MFEAFELGRTLSKEEFDAAEGPLREALLEAQMDLKASKKLAVVVIIGGVKGAGKRECVGVLNSWLDPRFIDTLGLREPSDEERERPPMWRFWRMLPPKGRIALFHGSWHTMPIVKRAFGRISGSSMERELERIRAFETMLVHEGVLVLKFWMHLAKKLQKQRMKAIEKDPLTSWRITHQDWENFERYDTFRKVSAKAIQMTSTAEAPWILVEATDPRHQLITVGRHILQHLRARLDDKEPARPLIHIPPVREVAEEVNPLRALDLSRKLEKKDYETELERWQGELARLARTKAFQKRSLVCVFEGMDAAGKGGGIRRAVAALDAGCVKVVPVAAPTEEERAQPYLWRFWRQLPRAGSATLFDRSWYGRVLVERVEGFAAESDWMRAYEEINAFEEQMHRHGTVVAKFWLQISQEEQLRRFEARADTAFKRFKITDDDWRNREKWPKYEAAICDMLERTGTEEIPWTLVPAEDKYFGRVLILKTLVERLRTALEG